MSKKRFKKNKFSVKQKIEYHALRDKAPGRFDIRYEGLKHIYSMGFSDGVQDHRMHIPSVKNKYGSKGAFVYSVANKRGAKAGTLYRKKTGKDPSDVIRFASFATRK